LRLVKVQLTAIDVALTGAVRAGDLCIGLAERRPRRQERLFHQRA
jgi:hypothetical protein